MELRDVNYKVDNLINKSLNLLKSELLVEIKIKEEISEIYINAFEKQKSSKGSGIGGNLVYRIIKAHKGELYLQDSKEGFKFYIEIPLKQNIEDK
jgi:sensor histidine kinase regulating citrate/malate metabolism